MIQPWVRPANLTLHLFLHNVSPVFVMRLRRWAGSTESSTGAVTCPSQERREAVPSQASHSHRISSSRFIHRFRQPSPLLSIAVARRLLSARLRLTVGRGSAGHKREGKHKELHSCTERAEKQRNWRRETAMIAHPPQVHSRDRLHTNTVCVENHTCFGGSPWFPQPRRRKTESGRKRLSRDGERRRGWKGCGRRWWSRWWRRWTGPSKASGCWLCWARTVSCCMPFPLCLTAGTASRFLRVWPRYRWSCLAAGVQKWRSRGRNRNA